MKKIIITLILITIITACLLPCLAYADTTDIATVMDKTGVMHDLQGATVYGRPFVLTDFPAQTNGKLELIYFAEYAYNFYSNLNAYYALYVYFYNPSLINIDYTNTTNRILIGTIYDNNNMPIEYEQFNLTLCDVSQGDVAGLFIKYRISGADKLLTHINGNNRRYDITSADLLTSGAPLATVYDISMTYNYTGFGAKCGENGDNENTLSCNFAKLDTITLNVKNTFFRTSSSPLGVGHQNQIAEITFQKAAEILENVYSIIKKDEGAERFVSHNQMKDILQYVQEKQECKDVFVIIRKNRNVSKYKSGDKYTDAPDDGKNERKIANELSSIKPVLILLEQSGLSENGWSNCRFWWPILQMPQNAKKSIIALN